MRRALESLGFAVRELDADGSVLRWERAAEGADRPLHDDEWPDWLVLPGGFAHGDALRAGALAARAPVMGRLRAHVERGRLVLGVCNGFQILTESRLLAGALLPNRSGHFEAVDRWVEPAPLAPALWRDALRRAGADRGVRPGPLRLPIANASGRFVAPRPALSPPPVPALVYAREDRATVAGEGADVFEIAGIFGGPRLNVLGLMPHPERAMDDERGAPADGRLFFEALRRYDRERP
jgi:phosphoribosylformylglycinamidine synthase subunit PurQ / glutaminase